MSGRGGGGGGGSRRRVRGGKRSAAPPHARKNGGARRASARHGAADGGNPTERDRHVEPRAAAPPPPPAASGAAGAGVDRGDGLDGATMDVLGDGAMVGTCRHFCGDEEWSRRSTINAFSRFERDEHGVAQRGLAVREYTRSAAAVTFEASEVRPPRVLHVVVRHLLHSVLTGTEAEPLAEVVNFVSDRLRSVRQDYTVQRVTGPGIVADLESMVRFHILASYLFEGAPESSFNHHQNDTLLSQCLVTLRDLYQERRGVPLSAAEVANEAETVAYDVCLKLTDSFEVACAMRTLPPLLFESATVQTALLCSAVWAKGQWPAFFCCFRAASPLQRCLLWRHVPPARRACLDTLNSCVRDQYPLSALADMLAFASSQEAAACCATLGLPLESEDGSPFTFDGPAAAAVPPYVRLKAVKALREGAVVALKQPSLVLGDEWASEHAKGRRGWLSKAVTAASSADASP